MNNPPTALIFADLNGSTKTHGNILDGEESFVIRLTGSGIRILGTPEIYPLQDGQHSQQNIPISAEIWAGADLAVFLIFGTDPGVLATRFIEAKKNGVKTVAFVSFVDGRLASPEQMAEQVAGIDRLREEVDPEGRIEFIIYDKYNYIARWIINHLHPAV